MLNGFLFTGRSTHLCDHLVSRDVPNYLQNIFTTQGDMKTFALDEDDIIKIFDMVSSKI